MMFNWLILTACFQAVLAEVVKVTTLSTTHSNSTSSSGSFLHITDIHVSANRPYSLKNLEHFCSTVLPDLIGSSSNSAPIHFLAVTGDLTDGMGPFLSLSPLGQQPEDWEAYERAMSGCYATGLPILKIRGNHDCFGVHSFQHPTNKMFRQQQFLGRNVDAKNIFFFDHFESGSFAFELGNSRFVFLEMGREIPAPHQYHGEFGADQELWLKKFIETQSHNYPGTPTYVFGHYPIGALTPGSRARLLSGLSSSRSNLNVYLSGHIHSVVGTFGAQCVHCHGAITELQLSDFKWSGIVRSVDVSSGRFVDIPTTGEPNTSSAVVQQMLSPDPIGLLAELSVQSVLSVYSSIPVRSVKLDEGHILTTIDLIDQHNREFHYKLPTNMTIPKYVEIQLANNRSLTIPLTDARLSSPNRQFLKLLFANWFECLHAIVLVMYMALVFVARKMFCQRNIFSHILSAYYVLSPVLPNLICHGLFGQHWVAASGIVLFDLETGNIVFESETTRIAIMLFVYILMGTAIWAKLSYKMSWRIPSNRWGCIRFGLAMVVVIGLALPTLVDFRMTVARGNLLAACLSPHVWFMALAWYVLHAPVGEVESHTKTM